MDHPLLSRGFAPLRAEYDDITLRLEGCLPPQLTGTFYRIGPNPQFPPRGAYNPLNGDGMIHAFRLAGGAVTYRNRWVRTRQFELERAAGRALFASGGLPSDTDESVRGLATDGVANTNLAWHAGRLLALEEGHLPIEIDPVTLATLGAWNPGGAFGPSMTAHPKTDPATGRLLTFTNAPNGRLNGEIALHVVSPAGEALSTTVVRAPYGGLVHDFAVTAHAAVLVVCPVTVSLRRASEGRPLIAWEPQRGAFVGVLPWGEPADSIRWMAIPARMVWHVVNAYEDGGRIILDVCEQDAAMFPFADGAPPAPAAALQRLARWTIEGGAVACETLHPGPCEYPRLDERRTGRPYRYAYLARNGGPGTDDLFHRGLGVFDHHTGRLATWDAKPTEAVGEPVFAPRSPEAPEGDGFLLTTIFDEAADTGSLALFDATDIAAGPIAQAHSPDRIPMGFHALWKPD